MNSVQRQLELGEARLNLLSQKKFHKSSEKHPNQGYFELNEAEVIAVQDTQKPELQTIPKHTRQKTKRPSKTNSRSNVHRYF